MDLIIFTLSEELQQPVECYRDKVRQPIEYTRTNIHCIFYFHFFLYLGEYTLPETLPQMVPTIRGGLLLCSRISSCYSLPMWLDFTSNS